jgi:hypothetical protein
VAKKNHFAALALLVSLAPAQTPTAPPAAPSATALTDAQRHALESIGKDLQSKIQPAALKLASLAKDYDRNLLAEKPDPQLEQKLANELTETVSQLVTDAIRARIQSVGEIAKLLTSEQKKLLLAELDKPGTNPDLVELIKKVLGDQK